MIGEISIDFRNRKPIYEQIVDRFEILIVNGVLDADSQLPSVRALAVELSINPNTIQKAYSEMELRGIIVSVKGRGSFVAEDPSSALNALREKLKSTLAEAAHYGKLLSLTPPEVGELLAQLWDGAQRP